MKSKETKRSLQAKESKKQIVEAYIELVRENGIENVTVEDICEKIHISVGRLYHYFKTKDDLLECFFYDHDKDFGERLRKMEGLSSKEKLLSYFLYLSEFNNNLGLEYTQRICNGKNGNVFLNRAKDDSENYGEKLSEEFIRDFKIQTEELETALIDYLRMIHRGILFDWAIRDGEYDLVQRTQTVMSFIMDSIIFKHSK